MLYSVKTWEPFKMLQTRDQFHNFLKVHFIKYNVLQIISTKLFAEVLFILIIFLLSV